MLIKGVVKGKEYREKGKWSCQNLLIHTFGIVVVKKRGMQIVSYVILISWASYMHALSLSVEESIFPYHVHGTWHHCSLPVSPINQSISLLSKRP